MLVKVVTITLVVCIITGSQAVVSNNKLANALLNFFNQLSSSSKDSSGTKDSALKIPLSDIRKLLNALIEENLKSVNVEDLQSNITIFAKLIHAQMTQDPEKLQQTIQTELEQLSIKLSPYSDLVNKQLSKTTEELQIILFSYFEDLQAQLEKNTLTVSQKLKSIALDLYTKTTKNADNMQLSLAPYSQKLEAKITESLEILTKTLKTCTEKVSEKIDQQVLALYQSLSPFADDMKGNLRKQTENMNFLMKKSVHQMENKILEITALLKKQMSIYANALKEENNLDFSDAKKTLDLYLIKMSQKVVAFKEMVTPYGNILNKALVKRVEDMKQKLGEYTVSVQDQMEYLEKDLLDKISTFVNSSLLTTMS